MSLPPLQLPAPWALAVILGIMPEWDVPEPLPVGVVVGILQGPSQGNFGEVFTWIESEYYRRGKGRLIEDIPWTSAVQGKHLLGTIRVAACEPLPDQRPGFRLTFSDQRPEWIPNPAPGRTGGQATPQPVPGPVAGPLFAAR